LNFRVDQIINLFLTPQLTIV